MTLKVQLMNLILVFIMCRNCSLKIKNNTFTMQLTFLEDT